LPAAAFFFLFLSLFLPLSRSLRPCPSLCCLSRYNSLVTDENSNAVSASPDPLSQGPLFLLDGNSIAYRAFYALPESIATSTGFPTNALYGFTTMVMKILADYSPGAVAVAWDSPGKTFRHDEFEAYKAHRKPMPDLLSEQWPLFEQLTSAFGFANASLPTWEADDVLATLATRAAGEGREVVIVTGDRDALQLVGENVRVMTTRRGVTDVKIYDVAAVEERFGVPPRLIPDLIGLKGDKSDNIPGVPGVGEKTAAQMLSRFGSLEEVLRHIREIGGEKRRKSLEEYRDVAVLSKKLAVLDCEAPVDADGFALYSPPDAHRLEELFRRFEFTGLLERLHEILPADDAVPTEEGLIVDSVVVDAADLEEALDWTGAIGLAADEDGDSLWIAGSSPASSRASRDTSSRAPSDTSSRVSSDASSDVDLVLCLNDPSRVRGLLREMFSRGYPVCHDLKASSLVSSLIRAVAHDTMIAGYLLAPGKRGYLLHDLLSDAGVLRGRVSGEAAAVPHGEPQAGKGAALSAAEAAAAVVPLARRQEERLRSLGMWDLFQNVELPLTGILMEMEEIGIHLDCGALAEVTARIEDRLEELQSKVHELAGVEFNVASPQQVAEVLFKELELPWKRKTKTGYSTDARTLEALRSEHEVVPLIEEHRELSKLLSTYLLSLPEVVDEQTGRLHTTFHQAVTATGRLSSSDPNLQNVPVRSEVGAKIRECFTAEEGNLLVVADYSQIELRILAYLSGEPTLLEAFAAGEDIHARTAAEVFDIPPGEVDATYRRYAKAVNFGIIYGISPHGLSQQLQIERKAASEYIERYFAGMPAVKKFIDSMVKAASEQGFVATIFGRRRAIPELRSDNRQTRMLGERLAVNTVTQGSAADIIKVAMIRCHSRLNAEFRSARMILQVHDELLFEVLVAEADAVKEIVVQEMAEAYRMEPSLEVDAGVGADWLAAK